MWFWSPEYWDLLKYLVKVSAVISKGYVSNSPEIEVIDAEFAVFDFDMLVQLRHFNLVALKFTFMDDKCNIWEDLFWSRCPGRRLG